MVVLLAFLLTKDGDADTEDAEGAGDGGVVPARSEGARDGGVPADQREPEMEARLQDQEDLLPQKEYDLLDRRVRLSCIFGPIEVVAYHACTR